MNDGIKEENKGNNLIKEADVEQPPLLQLIDGNTTENLREIPDTTELHDINSFEAIASSVKRN